MRNFFHKAIAKFDKLDRKQIFGLMSGLIEEHELHQVVFDSMTDGVIVTDKKNEIILFNKAAERMLPFIKREHYERKLWLEISDSKISDFFKKSLSEQGNIQDREFQVEIGNRVRMLAVSIMPLVNQGRINGNLFHIEDITEKKTEEAKLRRAENLASLTTLAAGVAHEIKNPLGSIGIHIQLIQKALKTNTEFDLEMVNHNLDIVNEEVERLNGIIVDFLFAVRPMDTHLENKNLNNFLYNVIDLVHFELEQKNISLIIDLSDVAPLIPVDEKYLKQAILNIIKNGVEAMPDGGNLEITTIIEGTYFAINISDNGSGISEENMAKIFEPYYTSKDFGSGLGLTLVYKIIKEHGGEITLNSREGKGTTFSILLPIPQKELHLIGYKES